MNKVMLKILQGSAVAQTQWAYYTCPVANFLYCICAENYENWLEVDSRQSYYNNKQAYFLAHPVHVAGLE